jgi:putative nucleotidyltransferase with HDIG domain
MSIPAIEVLRDRLKAFLLFQKSKLLAGEVDLDRLARLRRVSDVRIRQFAVGRAKLTAADLCGLLEDPKAGRFDVPAAGAKLLHRAHFALPLKPLGEEMGYVVEACLSLQVLGLDRMRAFLDDFVKAKGPPPEPTPSEKALAAPAEAREKPLPAPVAKLLGGVRELWSIPQGTLRILELLQVPDTPADAVCAEIERDPGLSAQCLRVVNSANFGLGTRIASIKRAVVTLGFQLTRRIVAISALVSRLGRSHAELDYDLRAFWQHSLWVAQAASLVSRSTRLGSPEEHFSAGLLHDVGKLVEYQHLRGPLKAVLEAVRGGATWQAAELQVLGVDHAEIGACLCERWRFPALIVESARHHLRTADELEELSLPREAMTVAALCHVAADATPPETLARWGKLLRLAPGKLAELRAQAADLARGSAELFAVA